MPSQTFFKNVVIDGQPQFLQCQQSNEGDLSLLLNDGETMYAGKLIQSEIIKMAKTLEMATDKLERLLLQCLTLKDGSDFEYQIVKEDETLSKLVLKQIVDGGFKFQIGTIAMRKKVDSSQRILTMLDQLTSQVEKYKKEVEELRGFNQLMSKEQTEMTKRLEGYVKAQETSEEELYSKFALVLNSKKAKIRELKEQLESGRGGGGGGGGGEGGAKTTEIKKKQKRRTIESEDEEFDTDDENERKRPGEESQKKEEDERKTNENIRLDDSIVDDDDDLPRKSRKRMRETKPKTPVGSVLPRTTSLPKPKSAQASSSNEKRTKRQISREITADELLDNL